LTATNDRSNGIRSNKADHDENLEDYGTPLFTQRKCVCHTILSDDNDLLAGETVMQGMKAAMGDGEVVQVAKSKPTSHNMGKQTMLMKS